MDAPTRSDPVVAALSEVIGGPVGTRAGHHPWWSPQRVLLATTAATLAVGMATRGACVSPAWAGNQQPYAELCWTELSGTASHGAAPWPASYATRLAERFGTALPSGSDLLATVVVLALLLAALALVATALLTRTDPARPWAAAGWAAGPVLAIHWLSWDLVAAVGVALALWGWSRRSAVALGLGGFLVVAFAHPIVTTEKPDVGSVWLLVQQWAGSVPGQGVRVVVGIVVVVLAAAVAVFVVRRSAVPETTATARVALVVGAAVLVVAPSAPPEAALLLLPLAAAAAIGWRDLLGWQACELLSWVITGWYLGGVLAPTDGGDTRTYWWAILLRLAGLLWLAAAALRASADLDGVDSVNLDRVDSADLDRVEGGRGEANPDVDGLPHLRHPRPQG